MVKNSTIVIIILTCFTISDLNCQSLSFKLYDYFVNSTKDINNINELKKTLRDNDYYNDISDRLMIYPIFWFYPSEDFLKSKMKIDDKNYYLSKDFINDMINTEECNNKQTNYVTSQLVIYDTEHIYSGEYSRSFNKILKTSVKNYVDYIGKLYNDSIVDCIFTYPTILLENDVFQFNFNYNMLFALKDSDVYVIKADLCIERNTNEWEDGLCECEFSILKLEEYIQNHWDEMIGKSPMKLDCIITQ